METAEFVKKITKAVKDSGLVTAGGECIFAGCKVVNECPEGAVALSGPDHCAFAYVSSAMEERVADTMVADFVKTVADYARKSVLSKPGISPKVSVKEYIAGLAKLVGGEAPTAAIGTTPIGELIEKCLAIVPPSVNETIN